MTKRSYDQAQKELATLARARREAAEAGEVWAIMDPRERKYQEAKARLAALETN